jgi:hypothetical protein
MLDQAIVDAQSLREAALNNAESAVVEKYSSEVKEVMSRLLEQDEDVELDLGMGDEEVEASAVLDDIPATQDPDIEDDEVVVIDLDQIIAAAGAEAEDEDQDVELSALEVADEIGLDADVDALEPGNRDDEVELNESDLLDIFQEMMVVDVDQEDIDLGEMLDEEEKEDYREEEVIAMTRKDGMDLEDTQVEEALREELDTTLAQNKELKRILVMAKERLEEVNLANARLLHANRVLQDTSLNEQQKNKIVEMISSTRSVDEAEMVYETLQKTMASGKKSAPQSLSEAVSRSSSVILSGRRQTEQTTDTNPVKDRWATLAGLNNK